MSSCRNYLTKHQLSLSYDVPLNIGIVGTINLYKGSEIIKQMADIIQERHLPVTITVIGELEGVARTSTIKITGAFKRDQLPELIERGGANIFFLPSIWPETFSFVTEELMQLGVPLAVFDLGAPAERVATYIKGLIIPEVNAEQALEQLISFYNKIRI